MPRGDFNHFPLKRCVTVADLVHRGLVHRGGRGEPTAVYHGTPKLPYKHICNLKGGGRIDWKHTANVGEDWTVTVLVGLDLVEGSTVPISKILNALDTKADSVEACHLKVRAAAACKEATHFMYVARGDKTCNCGKEKSDTDTANTYTKPDEADIYKMALGLRRKGPGSLVFKVGPKPK